MALLSVIRRWALRDQLSIREIARRTGLSRNTIRKYLRSGTVQPAFKVPERPSKLDPFADKLLAWLKTEAGKSRKKRRTLKQLHADLVALGYAGSYGRVAAFARKWKADRQREEQSAGRGTFVPLVFQPGEAFQFDWSEDWATIAGENTKLQVAHIKLSPAGRSCSGPTFCKRMRCCSMPTGTPSGSSAGSPAGASTTASIDPPLVRGQWTRRPRWIGSVPARRVRSTPGSWR